MQKPNSLRPLIKLQSPKACSQFGISAAKTLETKLRTRPSLLASFLCLMAGGLTSSVYWPLFSNFSPVLHGSSPAVVLGIDRIFSTPYLDLLKGKRVGVLAHQASRNRKGEHLVDLLAQNPDIDLRVIFAPEHGLRSTEDVLLPDSIDPKTGLPIFSLYGPRLAPQPEQLALIDVLLIDLQDVGLRFYTYASTMGMTLRSCRESGKKVWILDRPNPIDGDTVEGAVLEEDLVKGGLTNFFALATRHGMTMGELALLYNRELEIEADLTLVPMTGWKRWMKWEDTGVKWIPPSPALTTSDQAFLYSTFGVLESVNLAVGRGVTNEDAFRIYGAPWISRPEAEKVVQELNLLELPGLQFSLAKWIPTRAEYEGLLCHGVRVHLRKRYKVQGFYSLLETIRVFRAELGGRFDLSSTDTMIGSHFLRTGLENGVPTKTLLEQTTAQMGEFPPQRARALIY